MYEPFFTTKRDHVGLGLTTAQHIASTHAAVLRASRNPDAGMTFSVTFASGDDGRQTVLRSAT
jgi:C4-dicarboxylate-specific signal transduction histidine kinase